MTTSIGRLRGRVVVAVLASLLTPQFSLAAGPLRSGIGQRGLIDRVRPLRSQDAGSGKSSGGIVKRVIGGKNGNAGSDQAKSSKSQVLEKYGATTNGKWTSMGQPAPSAAAPKPSETAKPATPPAPTKVADTQPAKAAAAPGPSDEAVAVGDADLALEDVKFVEAATETVGPAYRLKIRNRGAAAAGKFRIGAFAERDGKLSDDAPQTVAEVANLAAGQTSEVTLRLPLAALKLVSSTSAQGVAFDQLLVVVDLDDAVVESEKSNNVANLNRTDLEAAAR